MILRMARLRTLPDQRGNFSIFTHIKGALPSRAQLADVYSSAMERVIALLILLALAPASQAVSDKIKEQRLSAQILQQDPIGEPVWLGAEEKFLTLFTASQLKEARGGIILIHGRGEHLNTSEIIAPLRSELPQWGWHTLSLQLPVVADDAPADYYEPLLRETPARISAAIEYLQKEQIKPIIIIGHEMGATLAASFISSKQRDAEQIARFVGIGMLGKSAPVPLQVTPYLEELKLPTLDLYGEFDKASAPYATKRAAISRKIDHPDYRQVAHPGADQAFFGLQPALLHRVRIWLNMGPDSDTDEVPTFIK